MIFAAFVREQVRHHMCSKQQLGWAINIVKNFLETDNLVRLVSYMIASGPLDDEWSRIDELKTSIADGHASILK